MKRVQSLFGEKYQTVRYVIATEDAEVAKDVSDEAIGKEIYIVDSTFFENCIDFSETMGEALRFQILKRVGITDFSALDGSAQPLHFPAIKMTAGERTLYHFAIHPEDLIKLAYVYRLELADPRGYQRPLKIDKIRKINQFIAAKGYFANNIVLCFDNVGARGVSFETQAAGQGADGDSIGVGTLTIPARIGIAEIVDGQHRLYGYLDSDKERKYDRILARRRKEDLLGVTAIADPREDERPLLFLDINANQTKVSAQNVWALMARWRPTTEIGFTAKVLYELAKCPPFKGRITIPSKTPAGLPLNIANFAKALKDRRLVAMGGQGENLNWNLFDGDRASSTYPLEVPKKTTQTLVRYFTAIRALYPNDWKAGKKGYTCTNDGAGVLLRVLTELLKYTHDSGLSPTAQVMHHALSGILDTELNDPGHVKALKRQSLGEAGRDAVAKRLCTRIAAKQSFKGFAESYTKRRGKK